jgi:hypothetical protein
MIIIIIINERIFWEGKQMEFLGTGSLNLEAIESRHFIARYHIQDAFSQWRDRYAR